MYLVLRVCRACNHRGTAKRPSTPSHSASRHSIFFSPRPRSPSVVPGAHRHSLFPGPRTSPLSRRAVVVSFSPLRRITLSRRRFVTSMRPFYNHYRFSQLDRGCAPRLSLSLPLFHFHSFGSSFPSSRLFTHASLARVPNSVALNYGWTDDARANSSAGAPRPPRRKPHAAEIYYRDARARARANIRSCANSPRHDCIYL